MMAPLESGVAGEPAVNTRSPTAVDRAVGTRIRRLRRSNGLTLRELGRAIGVSAVQLQRYETGASRVAASRLIAIANVLGASIDALLGEPREGGVVPAVTARRSDVVELVRIFSDIHDPVHRSAILAFIRAMARTLEVPLSMGPPFAQMLPGGLTGTIPADKS